MPQKVFKFTGINRKVNEFQNSGACEELVNLRPEAGGGYRVVKPKKVAIDTTMYDSVYEHVFGDTYNLIGVKSGIVELLNLDGSSSTISRAFQYKDVELSFAGNVLVISCESEKEQLVYKFEDDSYKRYAVALKPITNIEVEYATGTAYNHATAVEESVGAFQEALTAAASGFNNKFKNGLCGAAVIGCSYELNDGSELWSTAFVVADGSLTDGYQEPSFDTSDKQVDVGGARKVTLKLTFSNVDAKDVRRVNVYSTRPVFPYEFDNGGTLGTYKINKLSIKDMNLDGQIDEKIKDKRLKKLYSVQKKVVKKNYSSLIGKTFDVLAEGFDQNELVYYGRAYFNAPDIDGKVYFFADDEIEYGKYYKVRIDKATDYDLYGERL